MNFHVDKHVHVLGGLLLFTRLVVSNSWWPWTAACQASMAVSLSQNLFKLIPLNWWCHPAISSSVTSSSSCPQLFPAWRSFPMSGHFASDGQSIGASTLALPMNTQGWFPLGLTGLVCLLSEGLSRVFSSTTVRKHQLFHAQTSLWSNSHICTWPPEKS